MMTNKMLQRYIDSFADARKGWLEILESNPESVQAAEHILSINHKVEFLRSLWNWSEGAS